MSFGEKLSEIRKDRGIKQKALADILGIGDDMLSKYERGVHTMPDNLKIVVAKYFNISLDYLIGVIDEQIPYNRDDIVVLPTGFPKESIHKVKEYVRLLNLDAAQSKSATD